MFSPFSCFPSNRLACLSINTVKTSSKNNRKKARAAIAAERDDARSNDANRVRGLSANDDHKKQKLETQASMMQAHNAKMLNARRNTYMVTLASRMESEMVNMKNCFDMSRAIEPTPDASNPIWKLFYESSAKVEELREKQATLDAEEEEFNKSVIRLSQQRKKDLNDVEVTSTVANESNVADAS